MKLGPRALRVGWVAALLGAIALSVHGVRHSKAEEKEARYWQGLRQLEALDVALDREILRSRSGLVMHYDTLTEAMSALRRSEASLAQVPASLSWALGRLQMSLARIEQRIGDKGLLVERFKTKNAILRNSRQFYPALLEELRERLSGPPGSEALRSPLGAVLEAIAYFDVAPVHDAGSRLSRGLQALDAAGREPGASSHAAELALVLRHGQLIVEHSPVVDQLVTELLAVPVGREIRDANALYLESYRASQLEGGRYLVALAILGGLSVALALGEVITRLQTQARALRATQEGLERAQREIDRERQREHQQNELKTRFVSATSHEFRTPLTTILSSSQMLASYGARWDEERRLTHFERITTAAQHMSQMLDEILLIGRAEVGALVPVPMCFDLRDFCEALVESTVRGVRRRRRAPVRAGDALLETLPPSGAGGPVEQVFVAKPGAQPVRLWFEGERQVCLDQRLLTHVLGNVLENALKYSAPDGEIGLRVEVQALRVQLVVQDGGIGIEPSDLAHLFGAFQRGKNVGAVGGSGLGLAAVKRALDAQGGAIEIQSEVGRGTTVSVWLPLAAAPDGAAPDGAAAAASPTAVRAPGLLVSRGAAVREGSSSSG